MQELFKASVERGASDIHIKAGDLIRARIHDPDRLDNISGHDAVVDFEIAKAAANNPEDFDFKMRMFNALGETQPGVDKLSDDMTQMYGGS
jgi:Tfp pilus assembly pilus retraction ATPase PilT